MQKTDLLAARRSALFTGVDEATVNALLDASTVHEFERGNILFRAGEEASCLFMILDGLVGSAVTGRGSTQFIAEFVKPLQPFVISALLLRQPYIVTAQVVRRSRILAIPGKLFLRLAETDLSFSNALNRVQGELRRAVVLQVQSIMSHTAAQRLGLFLLTLIDRPRGQASVALPCDRQTLAGWLGILPTSISRICNQLEKVGVHGRGRELTVDSVERLREFTTSVRHTVR